MKVLVVSSQYPSQDTAGNPAVIHQVVGLRKQGLEVDVFPIDRAASGPLVYLRKFIPLYRRWHEGHYDLMRIQFGGLQALVGSVIGGKRSVITYHGTDLHGGFPVTWVARWVSRVNVWFSRQAARLAGGVAIVSPSLRPLIPRTVASPIRVLPPGVDYTLFSPQPQTKARADLGLEMDAKYILFSDISGSPVKRRDIALSAEKSVQRREPRAKILLLTQQPYLRVPLFLNAADCLLVTSEKEGSPNIVKEALAVNLPIVSVDVGDVALRCDGVPNCQIVSREINVLAEAVLRAFQMGRENGGRELKRPEIDNERICEQVHLSYQEALDLANKN